MTWWILFFLILVILVYLLPDLFIGGLKLDSRQTDNRNHYYNVIIYPDDIPTSETGLKLPNNIKYMQSHLSMHKINEPKLVLHIKNQLYDYKNTVDDKYSATMTYDFREKRWTTIGREVAPIDYYSFLVLFNALTNNSIFSFSKASHVLYTKGYDTKEIWQMGKQQCLRRLGSSISLIADAYANEILKKLNSDSNTQTPWKSNKDTTPSIPKESLFSRFNS